MRENKLKSFNKLEKKTNKVLFFVICMIILISAYLFFYKSIKFIKISELPLREDNNIWFSFDNVFVEKDKLLLEGWVMRQDSVNENVYLVLQEVDGNQCIIEMAQLYEREDKEDYYNENWEFGKTGITSCFSISKLDMSKVYELYLVLEYSLFSDDKNMNEIKNRKIATNLYVLGDKIYSYNPFEFSCPNFTDSELKTIVEEGILVNILVDGKVFIYEYQEYLYYIIDEQFGLLKDLDICIPVMPRTTKTELLPKHRIKFGFDHLGSFQENEDYRREGILPYQVIRVEIPKNYPITYITTGLYDSSNQKWVEKVKIRLGRYIAK